MRPKILPPWESCESDVHRYVWRLLTEPVALPSTDPVDPVVAGLVGFGLILLNLTADRVELTPLGLEWLASCGAPHSFVALAQRRIEASTAGTP